MNDTPRRRGRPKGTGIDDAVMLQTLAGMLAADEELKPTTAIHKAGVTDPSVVRRLRDKLKTMPAGAPSRGRAAAGSVSARQLPPRNRQTRAAAAPVATPPQDTPRTPAARPTGKSPEKQDTPQRRDPPIAEPIQTGREAEPADTTSPRLEPTAAPPETTKSEPPPQVTHPVADPQLEAMRLAAEAAAAMSRLYLHCLTHAAQTSPMTLALRGQIIMSQWLARMMTGQLISPLDPET